MDEQIAVIDRSGRIVDVNTAWIAFGRENGISEDFIHVGSNYLSVLNASSIMGDRLAAEAARGIATLLEGEEDRFTCEYPCHSPECKRWFMMRVTALKGSDGLFVVSHHDITKRHLAEEKAEYLSRHDSLTGLANRRYFDAFLDEQIRRYARRDEAVGLIVIDVDHFKEYNDAYGHPAGDTCLVRISRVLAQYAKRPDDLAVRLGGDEFALILGNAECEVLRTIAEAIRQEVYGLEMSIDGGEHRVTLSLGGISLHPGRIDSAEALVAAADRALYKAKGEGRNRSVVEEMDMESGEK